MVSDCAITASFFEAGHFYRIIAFPSVPYLQEHKDARGVPGFKSLPPEPELLPILEGSESLPAYRSVPPEPKYLPEHRSQGLGWKLNSLNDPYLIGRIGGGILSGGLSAILLGAPGGMLAYFAVASIRSEPYRDDSARDAMIAGGILGGILGVLVFEVGPVKYEPSKQIPGNIATNQRQREAWEKKKRPVEEHNAQILYEENQKREEVNNRLMEQWEVEARPIESSNRELLDQANLRIRAKNLVFQEQNRDRGKIEIMDIGYYQP
jgi:hypothetical protein